MPTDLQSIFLLILLEAGDTVARLWPYVAGGVLLALLLSRLAEYCRWDVPAALPGPIMLPVAALAGAASPLPTLGTVPLLLRFRAQGLPSRPVLAFAVASALMNPQLFVLTLGALGPLFAIAHVGAVLLLGMTLGLIFGQSGLATESGGGGGGGTSSTRIPKIQAGRIAGHVGLYFLLGVTAGASLHVLLPYLGIIGWLGSHGWLSSPLFGWIAAPFYVCGGSAVPLAASLVNSGFSAGAIFAFLVVGPALRGTTLASLGCLLPKRVLAACLALLALAGGLLGLAFDLVVKLG